MNNPLYIELTPVEKVEFHSKLMVLAQTDYFIECCELINLAEHSGLFKRIKPHLNESHPEILDLDNPIENY